MPRGGARPRGRSRFARCQVRNLYSSAIWARLSAGSPGARGQKSGSRPVSRVLYDPLAKAAAAIPLQRALPLASSGLPGGTPASRDGRAALTSCLALLRTGFAEPRRSPGALVSSYLTVSPLPQPIEPSRGGLFSVALSTGRPAWDFPQRPALWSPDFPQPRRLSRGRGRPADSRPILPEKAHPPCGPMEALKQRPTEYESPPYRFRAEWSLMAAV